MRTYTGTLALAAFSLAAFSTLSGCAYGGMTQVLRTQVASETDCPETKVSKRYVYDGAGDNEYQVTGCGETRNYVCPADEGLFSYDEQVCTPQAEGGDKPKLAKVGEDELLEGTPEIDTSAPEDDEDEEPAAEDDEDEEPAAEEPEAEEPAAEEPADEEAE